LAVVPKSPRKDETKSRPTKMAPMKKRDSAPMVTDLSAFSKRSRASFLWAASAACVRAARARRRAAKVIPAKGWVRDCSFVQDG